MPHDHHALSNPEIRLVVAVDDILRAIHDKGPRPLVHDSIMQRHRTEWPTLWAAIDQLLEATR